MKSYKPHVSSVGDAAANIISAVCYLFVLVFWSFGIVPILIIFLVEKKSGLVRFHAMQAILMWLVRLMLGGGMPFEGLAAVLTGDVGYLYVDGGWANSDLPTIAIRIGLGAVVGIFCLIAGAQAYYWRDWKVPVVGLAARLIVNHCRPAMYNAEATVPRVCEIGYTDDPKPEWEPAWKRDPDYRPSQHTLELAAATGPPPEPEPAEEDPPPEEEALPTGEEEAPEEAIVATVEEEPAASSRRLPAWLRHFEETIQEAQTLDIEIAPPKDDDPNGQLPPEMRDPPPAWEIEEAKGRAKEDTPKPEEKPPPAAPQRLTQLAAPEERAPDQLDVEEMFEHRMEEPARVSLVERFMDYVLRANRNLASPEQKGDPNGQLPLDMRDPPPPADMF